MTRTITAAEVIPGQRIRWTEDGTTRECTVTRVRWDGCTARSVQFRNDAGRYESTDPDAEVTVLVEAHFIQPEEPAAFGARVVVDGVPALRTQDGEDEVDPDDGPWRVRMGRDTWNDLTWDDLCDRGQVTVLPDPGWEIPATPVPTRASARSWDRWVDVPEYVAVGPLNRNYQVLRTSGCDQYRPNNDAEWMTAPFWVRDDDGPFIEVSEGVEA